MRGRSVVLALLLVFPLGACRKKGAPLPVNRHRTMADSADQALGGVRMLLTDHGVQRGELFADTAYVFDEMRRFELRKVRATFNTSTGEKDGVMSADSGRYNLNQQVLEGFGHVVIVTNEGRRLSTPQLRYSQAFNEVSSDSTFSIVEPGRRLAGVGFKSDPQLTRFQCLKRCSGGGSVDVPQQ